MQLERAGLFVDDIFIFSTGSEEEQMKDLNDRLEKLYQWSNDWGVDFNVDKTKHMRFTGPRRVKAKRRKLSHKSKLKPMLGGRVLKTVDEYKCLGVLFTNSLKFDRHVLEVLLPRVKQAAGHISHLLSKLQTGRCTFLRILWESKLRPILEYGSSMWSNFVHKSTLAAVDNFQAEFFRKAMGIPKKTSKDAILCDIAVLRQSYRFERERVRFRAKIDLDLCPYVVRTQVGLYETTSKPFKKYFRGQTIQEVVRMRQDFVEEHSEVVVPPKRETLHEYTNSLNEPTTKGYRLVYKCNLHLIIGEQI